MSSNFNCIYMAMSNLIFQIFLWNISLCRFIPIMQVRHILKKDHIKIFSSETTEPNLAGMILGWSPFKMVFDSPILYSRWRPLLRIEMSFVYCCFESLVSLLSLSLHTQSYKTFFKYCLLRRHNEVVLNYQLYKIEMVKRQKKSWI